MRVLQPTLRLERTSNMTLKVMIKRALISPRVNSTCQGSPLAASGQMAGVGWRPPQIPCGCAEEHVCCLPQETQKGDITLALEWMPVELDDM